MFTIRTATEHDVQTILEFIRGLAIYEKLLHEVKADEDALRETLFGDRPYAEVIIGEANGKPVGFALFFHSYSTFLGQPGIYLEDLFVLPDHRGNGYGTALLRRLAQIAVERECGRLEWSVLDWNEPAIQLYKKMGDVPLDEWTTMRVTGDALIQLAAN